MKKATARPLIGATLYSPRMEKQPGDRPSAAIELVRATPEQEPIVANLLQLYAHDFSQFHDLDLGPNGRFAYKQLPLYWLDPDRHPFLILLDNRLAGFTLIKRGSELSGNDRAWDMAEFFIVRGARRRGVGTEIAHQVWRLFPGSWEVRVMETNAPALRFWEKSITAFTPQPICSVSAEKDGAWWRLFSFRSDPSA